MNFFFLFSGLFVLGTIANFSGPISDFLTRSGRNRRIK